MLHRFMALAAFLALTLPAFGQGTTLGSISGNVFDPSGAVVPGAAVINLLPWIAKITLSRRDI